MFAFSLLYSSHVANKQARAKELARQRAEEERRKREAFDVKMFSQAQGGAKM